MEFTFSFNEQQLLLINKALLELTFREAAPLIDNINKQISEQIKDTSKLEIENTN